MSNTVSDDRESAAPALTAVRRWRRWPWLGGLALLVIVTANHAEYHLRQQRLLATGGAVLAVRQEGELMAGHSSIGIDETASTGGGFLRFATLAEWDFDPKVPSPCPASVGAWNGRDVSCVGFMYPLEPGGAVKAFCLLRSTQICCYGPRPQYNQYLLVEMPDPVRFERLRPVLVRGRFVVDPQPDEGFIYRLTGVDCTPAGDEEPEIDAAEFARRAGLPLFDFAWLAAVDASHGATVPPELAALVGKTVVVAGYFLDRTPGAPPRVLLARDWWDGVSKGVRPTLGTALAASLQDAAQLPPLWKERGQMTGTLRLQSDPKTWPDQGIVSLQDAVRGVTGSRLRLDRGPFLEWWHEALVLAVFARMVVRAGRRKAVTVPASEDVGSTGHA